MSSTDSRRKFFNAVAKTNFALACSVFETLNSSAEITPAKRSEIRQAVRLAKAWS